MTAVEQTGDPASTATTRRAEYTTAVIAVVALIALFVRLYRLSQPNFLYGIIGYDDGVYFGASIQLIHGQLPYNDFIFVHPPLLPILMTPFAALTHVISTPAAFAWARVFTAFVGAGTVVLLGRLLRHRGWPTVAIGCALLALQDDSISAAHSVFLEPYLVLFTLAGLLLLFDGDALTAGNRRLVWGGVLLGLAFDVKVFAVAPIVVVLAVALRRPPRALRILIGTAAGVLVPLLPFLIASPIAFGRDVFISQLKRTDVARTSVHFRLWNLLGFGNIDSLHRTTAALLATVVLVLVVAAAYGLAWWLDRRRPTELEIVAIAGAIVVAAMFLYAAQFYWHYAAFFAPFGALVVALPTASLLAHRPTMPAWSVVAAALVVIMIAGMHRQVQSASGPRLPLARIHNVIPATACVVTNAYSLALAADRATAGNGCPPFVDGLGTDIVFGHGRVGHNAGIYAKVRQEWVAAFRKADYALIDRNLLNLAPWNRAVLPYLKKNFRPVGSYSKRVGIWKRKVPITR